MPCKCKPSIVALLPALFLGCATVDQQPRLDSIVIEVTGEEFHWHFRYPGRDGVLGTADDRHSEQNLYVPDHSTVYLQLKSKDYVYSFALPELGLREVAVPGLNFGLQFNTREEQTLQLKGDQLCGFAHESLIGTVFVRNQDSGYYGW